LNKKPTLCCEVKLENGFLSFMPLIHDASMKGRGYTDYPGEPLKIESHASDKEILALIIEAYERTK